MRRSNAGKIFARSARKFKKSHWGIQYAITAFAARGNAAQIDGLEGEVAELCADGGEALVGQFQEAFEQAEFVHQFERGGMDGVATEVAEEVAMFFEDGDGDAGTGQQVAEHHAGGSAADHAAGGFKGHAALII